MPLVKGSYKKDNTQAKDAERNVNEAQKLFDEQGYAELSQIRKVTNFPETMIAQFLTDEGWVEKEAGQYVPVEETDEE